MKLSKWAKDNGLNYRTAWNLFKKGLLPVDAIQLKTGTILVKESMASIPNRNVVYCRVNSYSRKDELEYQVARCEEFCRSNGWVVDKVYKEIASGLNDERKEFWKTIDSRPSKIVVENKDRLTRFGFNYLERLLKERGCDIVVIHRDKEDEKDLMKDLVSIIYSFCAKLHGLRRAYDKTKKCEKLILKND